MSFSDLDPVEEYLGKPVTAMTDQELVSYIKVYARAVHDLDLPVQGTPERSVMSGLRRTYGAANAGRLVKWACRESIGSDPVGYFDFAKGRKWWTDRQFVALQGHVKKEAADRSASAEAELGWGSLKRV